MSKKIEPYEEKMKKSIATLNGELDTVRVGRANPKVLEHITVDYYGTETPLSQVGTITVPEARLLQIAPWEANMLKAVERAIQSSDLGINPTNDGKVIRLMFPELDEERRKTLAKDVKKKGEDCKVAIRNIRRDGIEALKKIEKRHEISEDELLDLEDEMQKITDKYISLTDKTVETKTKDVMSI